MSILGRLRVENYRQFDRFELGDLRHVNLLVGKNNSGKTALLEAVQIATSEPTVGALTDIAFRRGEVEREDDRTRTANGAYASIRHLWPGHIFEHGHAVGPIFESTSSVNELQNRTILAIEPPNGGGPSRSPKMGQLAISRNGRATYHPIDPNGLLSPMMAESSSWEGPTRRPVFLSIAGFGRQRLAELYNVAVTNSQEHRAEEALRILDPSVKKVFFLDPAAGRPLVEGEGVLIETSRGREPLGSAGDGMRLMLGLGLALANSAGGILLIDEIDTGLHYSSMSDMWRLVTQTAIDLGTQVFATTHSLDCLAGIASLGSSDSNLVEHIAVHKIDPRRGAAVTIPGRSLVEAIQNDVELR